jgi:hypothetical protein
LRRLLEPKLNTTTTCGDLARLLAPCCGAGVLGGAADLIHRSADLGGAPGVRAGQLHVWNAETVLSHGGLAEVVTALAGTVGNVRPDVV